MVNLQQELSYLQSHLSSLELPNPPPPVTLAQTPQLLVPPAQSLLDLPPVPAAYDFTAMCESVMPHSSWSLYPRQQQIEQRQFSVAARGLAEIQSSTGIGGGGGDLQELARELLNRHAPPTVRCRNQASSLPPNSR